MEPEGNKLSSKLADRSGPLCLASGRTSVESIGRAFGPGHLSLRLPPPAGTTPFERRGAGVDRTACSMSRSVSLTPAGVAQRLSAPAPGRALDERARGHDALGERRRAVASTKVVQFPPMASAGSPCGVAPSRQIQRRVRAA